METKQFINSQKEKYIVGKLMNVTELSNDEKLRMLELLNKYFDNVDEYLFFKDLSEKQWVILFVNPVKEIQGFSTQTLITAKVEGVEIKALFSGDTIIDKDYWGSRELPRIFGRLVMSLIEKYKGIRLYWFYISKGYMTYMLMPRYFHEFYPKFDLEISSFNRKVLDALAFERFGTGYDSSRGIVKIQSNYYLKKGIGFITNDLLNELNIKYFKEKNPNYFLGEELACLVELKEHNMKQIFRQLINDENEINR